jgi:hypothetical protein
MEVCGRNIRIEGRLLRIARLDADKYHFLDDPKPVLDGLRKCGARIDLFTFLQRLPEMSPKYSYPMEWDTLAALPIASFEDWWKNRVDCKTRNMVRKAEKKGLTLKEVAFDDALVEGIWAIYNECPIRQGRRFSHYGKDRETVYRLEATYPDSSIFIGAYIGDKLVGFAKLLLDEIRTQAGLLNIISMVQHRDKAPTNALIAQAVRSCADRKIAYLVYSNFAYGTKQRDTLSDFKENNGFERFDLPRYYVPFSRFGSVALRLGLHRRLVDLLPVSVAATLRELRNSWNNRKMQSAVKER